MTKPNGKLLAARIGTPKDTWAPPKPRRLGPLLASEDKWRELANEA